MFKAALFYGLSLLLVAGSAANAAESCDTYFVAPGDTLRLISERYYGARDLSPIIYKANSGVIGRNPNTIEIGMELSIPCRENIQYPQESAFLARVGPEAETSDENALYFLAKVGNTPYIGTDGSGIVPSILAAAMREGGSQNAIEIARPDSISDVLRVSSEPNALLSFPWIQPNCDDLASLSPQSAYLCQNYTFSDPLFEVTLGIFTVGNSPLVSVEDVSSFEDTSICVPQLYTTDMLIQNGIAGTNASITTLPDLASCVTAVNAGEYDAFIADYLSFRTLESNENGLVDIPAFAHKYTLHAAAYSQNPVALETLAIANAGLKELLFSGEWFAIVNEHLASRSY